MEHFYPSPNILNRCVKTTKAAQSTAAFFFSSPSIGLNSSSFAPTSEIEDHPFVRIQQKNLPILTHHHVNPSSSFTLTEIKREPCQVSEVTTSHNLHSNPNNSKSMSSATMTTIIKIESTSTNISDMDNLMPVGVAVMEKRLQDSTTVQPQKDINYLGIRVADIGHVAGTPCGNIHLTGRADLISGANTENINSSINNAGHNSTLWQYPDFFPLESVISMTPFGLQSGRDPSRSQLVFLPASSAVESFPHPSFLSPPVMQQNSAGAFETKPNFILSSQTSAPPQSYQALELLGSNYITTAAANASPTVCQNPQASSNRFLNFLSDTGRIEQSQKHNGVKVEHWFQQNSKGNSESNSETTYKVDKSKFTSESNYFQSNKNRVDPMPLMLNEQPDILMKCSLSPSELPPVPMISCNYATPPYMAPQAPSQKEEVSAVYKNAIIRFSDYSKKTETQDVNIQTDTPVCSDDEDFSLEVSLTDPISCDLLSFEENKTLPTQCHYSFSGRQANVPEKSSSEAKTAAYDISYPITPYTFPEIHAYKKDSVSNRSDNKNKSYTINRPTVFSTSECSSKSSTLRLTHLPPLLEMSGLELLSNISTGSFPNHESLKAVGVKEEPREMIDRERANEFLNNYESFDANSNTLEVQSFNPSEKNNHGAINLSTPRSEQLLGGLSLLCALAEQRIQEEVENTNINNSLKDVISESRRRKHKHSKSKSNRHSRYYKRNKKKHTKDRKESMFKSDCEYEPDNLRSIFKTVDSNYKNFNKWADHQDFFKAMECDMRMRLADITRQYRKKKRKLDEIIKIKKFEKTYDYKFANISCKNPSFMCFLDKFQSTSTNSPPPNDDIKVPFFKIQKNNTTDCPAKTSKESEETSTLFGEGTSSLKSNTHRPSDRLVLLENKCFKEKKNKRKHIPHFKADINTFECGALVSKCQKQQRIAIKYENNVAKKIDKKLILSKEHLYRKETRVLTDMGGLFYAGVLKPLQPPEVYAIALDGERGNKSQIMSREEIFKDTILEVVPKTIENVPTGTRLCAYWSQQYRCLYPGKAIVSHNTDVGSDFVSVEFDDGDNGRIRLQNIRFLLSDYPTVEYNENPFNNFGKNKKKRSIETVPTDTSYSETSRVPIKVQDSDHISFDPRNDRRIKQIEKNASPSSNLSECLHKHNKQRKKKKHKKHHHKKKGNGDIDLQIPNNRDLQPSQQTNTIKQLAINENTRLDKSSNSKLLDDHAKHEINETDEDSLTSNVVFVTSDGAKNERIDFNNGKGSKIAAFLPERQLWGWLGKSYRKTGLKGRTKKQFYKSITRGKETITVGECAVFLSTGRPDRPYIGRIEAMWETTSSNKIVRVRWFYHPEETTGCPPLKFPGALFDSPHEDENDVQTISHRCEVVEFSVYIAKFGSGFAKYQSIYDNNDTYYLSGYYHPKIQALNLQTDIPTLEETSL